jgi:hypothetical protein
MNISIIYLRRKNKMKKLPIVLSMITVLSLSSTAYAAKNESAGTGMTGAGSAQAPAATSQAQVKASSVPSGSGMQVQNQVQTQNKGEESQLQVKTMDQTQSANGVSEAVLSLLAMPERKGGIGQEVKMIAQQQNDDQPKINASIEKIQTRSKLAKTLFGADKESLKELKQLQVNNQLRIESMQELMTRTTNEAELTELKVALSAMVDQNAEIASEIVAADSTPGVFGWMLRLFKLQ